VPLEITEWPYQGQEVVAMPRFIAVHPLAFTEEQLKPLAKEQLPEGATWHGTYCAVAENKSYCHWESPTTETLVGIFKKYEIPYEAIHEVRHFDPATGQMEPAPMEVKVPQPV
jgi:hypothetical protein